MFFWIHVFIILLVESFQAEFLCSKILQGPWLEMARCNFELLLNFFKPNGDFTITEYEGNCCYFFSFIFHSLIFSRYYLHFSFISLLLIIYIINIFYTSSFIFLPNDCDEGKIEFVYHEDNNIFVRSKYVSQFCKRRKIFFKIFYLSKFLKAFSRSLIEHINTVKKLYCKIWMLHSSINSISYVLIFQEVLSEKNKSKFGQICSKFASNLSEFASF